MPPAVADMKSLVQQGRFADAFSLGMKHESLAGEPIYDYYFGVAAVDSGRASLGVLALERVLLSNPGNDLARLELARGYFVLEDYERAREEFLILAAKDLPPSVKASIEKYLGAIRGKDPEFRTVSKGYIEYAIGHNSNVNSSTNQSVLFPLFGQSVDPVLIQPDRAKSSALSQLAVGLSTSGPIVAGVKYNLGVDVSHRQYSSVDSFDQTTGGVGFGVEYGGETALYRLSTFAQQAQLDSNKLRDTYGLAVEYSKPLNKETSIRGGLGFAQLRYAGDNESRNADLPTLALGFNTYIGGVWKAGVDATLNIGREKNLKGRSDFTRDIYGVRFVLGFQPAPRWQGSLMYAYTKSNYEGPDQFAPAEQTYKNEDLHNLELGLQYQLTRGWSARGELGLTKNISNVTLYEYDQKTAFIKMRYEWK